MEDGDVWEYLEASRTIDLIAMYLTCLAISSCILPRFPTVFIEYFCSIRAVLMQYYCIIPEVFLYDS